MTRPDQSLRGGSGLPDEAYAALQLAYFSGEPDEREVLDRLTPFWRRARLFVDVGASLGQFTLAASRSMPGGKVIAIEADPGRFDRLKSHCAEWAQSAACAIQAVHAAASDSDGTATFQTTNSSVSGGLFQHDLSHLSQGKAGDVRWREVSVPARRLDALVGNAVPDLVKIDVEGAELRVLRGASGLLAGGRTRFLVELHPWPDPGGQSGPEDVLRFMRSHGYRAIPFAGKTMFVKSVAPWELAWLVATSVWERAGRRLKRTLGAPRRG